MVAEGRGAAAVTSARPWSVQATAAGASVALALAIALGTGYVRAGPVTLVDLAWLPQLGSRFVIRLDPLGAPLAILTAAIAAPVLAYSGRYLREQLDASGSDAWRFSLLMLAFVGSMVTLMLAHDLLLMFAALETTALVSFLLIEFDRDDDRAARAAGLALVVTAGSSLLFLAGVVLVARQTGTTVLSDLTAAATPLPAGAASCLAAGVLAKSAQFPLHFWLPRAMVAPTPVSAYLHSSALVAAGVFVLARLRELLATPELMTALMAVGLASIATGAALALVADGLKRILAGSTIAQYGYCVVLIALGEAAGAIWFFLAHGLAKCALFLTAGAVTTATGHHNLSATGGLFGRMPTLAVASAVAAAALAGLPATVGYFKDEALLAASADHGAWLAVASTVAVALTIVYAARFWLGVFVGWPARIAPSVTARRDRLASWRSSLTWPVVLLAGLAVLCGTWTAPFEPWLTGAAASMLDEGAGAELAYRLSPHPALWLTLAAWASGVALVLTRRRWDGPLQHAAGAWLLYWTSSRPAGRLGEWSQRLSDQLHELEVRDLRDHITAVLLPVAVLVGLAMLGQTAWPDWGGWPGVDDLTLIAGLAVTAGAAVVVLGMRHHVSLVIAQSFVGFGLGLTLALEGAPDVALVVIVVETLLTILLLAMLRQLRPEAIARTPRGGQGRGPRAWIGPVAAAAMFVLAWFVLGDPRPEGVERAYVGLAASAHAKDVVTAVLADFRGLDTAGEITVFAVAVLGAAGVTWGRVR